MTLFVSAIKHGMNPPQGGRRATFLPPILRQNGVSDLSCTCLWRRGVPWGRHLQHTHPSHGLVQGASHTTGNISLGITRETPHTQIFKLSIIPPASARVHSTLHIMHLPLTQQRTVFLLSEHLASHLEFSRHTTRPHRVPLSRVLYDDGSAFAKCV